ncbi:hypothetical protein M885DRAFT_564759 [Pelagophyceae sp. CCMP2097]|nr:hypothetical protein M885DRAFT_564759 [Pelagophyceae sp. CCMP2097]
MSSSDSEASDSDASRPRKRFQGRAKFKEYGAIGGKAQLSPNSRSVCKELSCRAPIARHELRLGKQSPSITGHAKRISWFHVGCIFRGFRRSSYCTKTILSLDDVQCVHPLRELSEEQQCTVVSHIQEHLARRKEREKQQRTYEPPAPDGGVTVNVGDFEAKSDFQWWTEGVRWLSPKMMRRMEIDAEAQEVLLKAEEAKESVWKSGEDTGSVSSEDDFEALDTDPSAPKPAARRPRACHLRPRAYTLAALEEALEDYQKADVTKSKRAEPKRAATGSRKRARPAKRVLEACTAGVEDEAFDGSPFKRLAGSFAPSFEPSHFAAKVDPTKDFATKSDPLQSKMDPFWVDDVPWNSFFDDDEHRGSLEFCEDQTMDQAMDLAV